MLAIFVSSSAFPVKTYETAKQSRNPRLSLAAKAVTLVVAFNTTMLVVSGGIASTGTSAQSSGFVAGYLTGDLAI